MNAQHYRLEDAGLVFDTDPALLDLALIHRYLSEDSYWVPGISAQAVAESVCHSLNFGVYATEQQLAFARVVTDTVGFAWLCDVFVIPEQRGRGIGKRLISFVRSHPQLQNLRRFMLATRDAHGLYREFGFAELAAPARYMESLDPDAVRRR